MGPHNDGVLLAFERHRKGPKYRPPEKIIKTWEGDTYQYINGHVKKMRACDHNTIQDLYVTEYVPPNQTKGGHEYSAL